MKLKLTRLDLSWAISRGQDTYGYNICRLDDSTTRKRYKCSGGGYDMIGTCFGEWLADVCQPCLAALFDKHPTTSTTYSAGTYKHLTDLYGISINPKGVVSCDGACGVYSMIAIANAIGLDVQQTYDRKGRTNGFIVSEELK